MTHKHASRDILRLLVAGLLSATVLTAGMAFAQSNGTQNTNSTLGPTQQQLDNAASSTSSWLMYNKGYNGQRYSTLSQINTSNASLLQPKCAYQLGSTGSFEANPVVYKGVLYITTAHITAAIDATNCNVLWKDTYNPTGPEPFSTDRGVALYNGMVFRGTTDGHLLALNMRNGNVVWNQQIADSKKGYFISSAPIVYDGKVLVGTAGADWGADAHMFAFNASNGNKVWEFNEIVPKTFGNAKAASTGGGSNWTSYTLNTKTGLVYVPVGNPAPDLAPEYRPGKNLYTDSVIVLNAATGKLVRYYQQIPNDSKDRDTAAAPVLFTANGTPYMAAANKNGHLFVYNRNTNKLVYKVPVTTIQNDSVKPTKQGIHVCPGINGGEEWNGPAYDPQANELITTAVDWCTTFKLGEVRYVQGQFFLGGSFKFDPAGKASGWVDAFNPTTGAVLWKYHAPEPMVAGVTPTAGGVIFTGNLNGNFLVLNAMTGNVLYKFDTGGGVATGPSTYSVNGTQYVAVGSGDNSRTWHSGGSATVYIFALH